MECPVCRGPSKLFQLVRPDAWLLEEEMRQMNDIISGKLNQVGEVQEVEMRVESGNTGFVAELWGTIPNIVTAYLISQSGEKKSR